MPGGIDGFCEILGTSILTRCKGDFFLGGGIVLCLKKMNYLVAITYMLNILEQWIDPERKKKSCFLCVYLLYVLNLLEKFIYFVTCWGQRVKPCCDLLKMVLSDSPFSSLVFHLPIHLSPPPTPSVYFHPFERVPCIILYILLKSYFLSLILN